jgi:hypothetical protein
MTNKQFENYFRLSGKALNDTASCKEIKELKRLRKDWKKLKHVSIFKHLPSDSEIGK